MDQLVRDFVSHESRDYKFKLGSVVASSLSGFLAGLVASSIVWMFFINVRFFE
ncbi:MAG: hypothetical protein AAB372_01005 [Patescibacteria group bacterium]